jgi:carbamoyltransferase
LADPRNISKRDHLNKVVKNRELFRPFAPVILEEAVTDYFDEYYPSYFMSFVASVRPEKRSIVPAITHVDGTSRYQVLRQQDNLELYEIVRAFAQRTGIPMLLNTSFNRAGEPIVETPLEAVRCMLDSSIDYIVMDGFAYRRNANGTR